MSEKTVVRDLTIQLIRKFPAGHKFTYSELYKWVETNFPDLCSKRGDARTEPRYKWDVRAAVWDARLFGLIRHTGLRGQRVRV